LLSSISIAEREGGPEGIAVDHPLEGTGLGWQYGTAVPRKKIRYALIRDGRVEPAAEPGLVWSVFSTTFDVDLQISRILYDRFISRSAGCDRAFASGSPAPDRPAKDRQFRVHGSDTAL
jgi:hypothetical protein